MTTRKQLGAWAAALCGCFVYGCALDARRLGAGSGDELVASPGGAPTAGAPAAAGDTGPSDADGGRADGGAETDAGAPSCPDLDTDGMPDCVGTLLENGGFDSDATAWQAGENTEMAWSVNDGGVRRTSGSLELTSPAPVASASQCIAFDAAPLLVTWGQTFIEPSAQAQTQAWIEVQLFAQPDCQGDPSGFFDTPASSAMGGWNVVQAGGIAGSDTHSVRVSVNALAPHDLAKTPVRFDNVMLKAKPLD